MLSSSLGISNGSSYYCIKALIEKGFVKLENFKSSENKRHYSYILTKKGIIEKTILTADFLKRKKVEYNQIKDEINSVTASIDMQTDNKKVKSSQGNQTGDMVVLKINKDKIPAELLMSIDHYT